MYTFDISLAQEQELCKPIVIQYLKDYGYIDSSKIEIDIIEFKRLLRHFQRENNLYVNGKITPEVCKFVKNTIDRQMVIDFLKTYNYFINGVNPISLKEAVKKLQYNSGSLEINGEIDQETINFINTNRHGHFEPPLF
jgi:hypothetical protein